MTKKFLIKSLAGITGILVLFTVTGCAEGILGSIDDLKEKASGVVKVKSVSLDQHSLELAIEDEINLSAIVGPANATNKAANWASSDSAVAAVTNGKVIAISAGTAKITVTTSDGSYSDSCGVTVVNGYFVGNGDSASPYLIRTAAKLAKLSELIIDENAAYSGKHYRLMSNLDLSSYGESFNNGKGWIPIGPDTTNQFKGHFDGNGKTISNLFINNIVYNVGLFGRVVGGTVTNLNLINVNVTGNSQVGGVTGYLRDGGTISNCHVSGMVTSASGSVGGLAGGIGPSGSQTDNSMVINCHTDVTVTCIGEYGSAGGVSSGINGSSMINCHATGKVNGTYDVGGVVGYSTYSTISNCYATGSVTATGANGNDSNAGGVVGSVFGDTISRCYATGAVTGPENNIGGFAGRISYSSTTISDCYATGAVSGGRYAGGLIGYIYTHPSYGGGSVYNCYASGEVSAESYAGGVVGRVDESSSLSNCAALNLRIIRKSGSTDTTFGRVAGSVAGVGLLSNNYANHIMLVLGYSLPPVDPDRDKDKKHGADVSGFSSQNWWKDSTAGPGFKFGTDDDNPWKMRYGLPVLYWQ